MLKIEHLTKIYGEKKAVDDLSLHIRPGEIYGFIGHNGAGKTTTLKSVVGILKFDEGEIQIDGTSIKDDPVGCKRKIAYIPDNPDLYDYMTGIKYLNFIADIFGVSAEDRMERIRDYADRFELTDDLAQPIAAYSHGMKQKLALSCALIHRPDVLFLDEPTTGVDPVSRSEFWDMLDRLKRQGITILVSTPYMDEASRCDRIALVRSGECLSIDTPVGIRTSFDRRLYAVRCASMYKLLGDLREFPDTNSCFAFGDAHHLTLRRDGEDVMRRLQEYLKGKGYADVSIERLEPSVEDCFMAL